MRVLEPVALWSNSRRPASFLILAMTLAAFLLTPVPVFSVERTGEILRELVAAVEGDIKALEARAEGFKRQKQSLLKELDAGWQAFQRESRQGRREKLAADVLLTLARLNRQDLGEVGAYLETTAQILPKLRRIKEELSRGGNFKAKEDFLAYRNKMGTFMTRAAGISSS